VAEPTIEPSSMVGTWTIARELVDRTTDQSGTFSGELAVAADTAGFTWKESGTLTWMGRTRPAFRHLALRQLDGLWWMTFSDGRPFHPWRSGVELTHPCGADMYRGDLASPSPDQVHITWDITGPAKNQRIVTELRRLAA
jgi:Family of unknown function (DUF6314)